MAISLHVHTPYLITNLWGHNREGNKRKVKSRDKVVCEPRPACCVRVSEELFKQEGTEHHAERNQPKVYFLKLSRRDSLSFV